MLILTRKAGQSIAIGDGSITVCVMEIKGRQVRLGIEAPPDTPIHRQEIFQKIVESNKESVAAAAQDLDMLSDLLGLEDAK
ncbi:carbon storage regulator, CsrA [Desulfarculus baarsii DSM 2075]|uniref:Translational regulator CsrA n=1 Tax=Desulfarculus baarsii (strain ATCC 33931 / DSM 2075 / LMG 7858 / VKM B-1802 / 2st14) TaxID=644282 RepID=E1QJF7_DESB2|nr:carbon storage regulator CsrA [Desulfarculus baarsii]ADK85700.1 carbon storage regulator, CsrA [Desulfarculus baarsii DSM 2075]